VHTFRWQAGPYYFTLQFWVGDTWSPAYLTRDDMIAMLEVVMGVRESFPERTNLNSLVSVEDAEAAAGFNLLAPAVLPEGFIFSHASYEPDVQRMVLIYAPQGASRQSSGARLVIFETPLFTPAPVLSWDGFPAGAVETVAIGEATGTFVRGAVVDGVYDPDLKLGLSWETGSLRISIHFWNSESYPARLERDQLISIAESMH
jgi:hypothetical protein